MDFKILTTKTGSIIKHQDHVYKHKTTLNTRGHSTVWQCAVENCQAYLKLGNDNTKITEHNTKHEHSLSKPKGPMLNHSDSSSFSSESDQVTPKNTMKPKGALFTPSPYETPLNTDATCDIASRVNRTFQGHQTLKKSLSNPETSPRSETPQIPIEGGTKPPKSPSLFELNLSNGAVGNSVPPVTRCQEYLSFKIKYEEVKSLNDSLIDKIVEKEKKIWELEASVTSLNARIADMESSHSAVETASQDRRMREDLEEHKTLVSSLLTTVRTLEAALSNDNGEKSKKIVQIPDVTKPKLPNVSRKKQAQPTRVPRPPSTFTKNSKIVIVGDSHVRQLQGLLATQTDSSCQIQCVYKGGSKLCHLQELLQERNSQLSKGDVLIIFSGTNDVCHTSWNLIKTSYEQILSRYVSCKIGVFLIPLRRGTHQLNPHIKLMNQKISDLLSSRNVTIMDPEFVLQKSDYSPDGLHLNKHGKDKLCGLISSSMLKNPSHSKDKKKMSHPEPSQLSKYRPKFKLDRDNRPHIRPRSTAIKNARYRQGLSKTRPGFIQSNRHYFDPLSFDHYDYDFNYGYGCYDPYEYDYDYYEYGSELDYFHDKLPSQVNKPKKSGAKQSCVRFNKAKLVGSHNRNHFSS